MGMQIEDLPAGRRPPALRIEPFPTRWQAVVWRNWNLVAPERIGEVIGASREEVAAAAAALGLPPENRAKFGEWLSSG